MSYIPSDTIRRAARPYGSAVFNRIPLLYSRCTGNQGTTAGKGGTTRLGFLTSETCSGLQFVFENVQDPSTGEAAVGNPITIIPVFEYPAYTFHDLAFSVTPTFITAAGQAAYTIPQWGRLKTDMLALTLTGVVQPWVRTHVMLSLPPAPGTGATSTTGGTLAAGSYSYTITQVAGPQGESGPGTAVVIVTTGGTSSNTLTWTYDPLSVPNTAVNVYRGSLLLATLPANTVAWTDTGALTAGTQAPPAAQKFPVGPAPNQPASFLANQGTNIQSYGGTGANVTKVAAFSGTFTNQLFGYGPSCVLATPDSGVNKAVCLVLGDSIADGQNSIYNLGYPGQALLTANIPWYLLARAAQYSGQFLGALARMRLAYAEAASDAIDEYGINDSWGGITLAALQANCITNWREVRRRGVLRIHRPTLSPRVQTTDTMVTLAGQSPGNLTAIAATNASPVVVTASSLHGFTDASPVTIVGAAGNTAVNGSYFAKVAGFSTTTFGLYSDAGLATPVAGNGAWTSGGFITPNPSELVRQAFNAWVLDGCPMNPLTFAPAAVGTASGAACVRAPLYATSGTVLVTPGFGAHLLASVFNPWSAIEVNAAGTFAVNGGRWPVNGTAGYASDSTHMTQALAPTAAAQVPTALMTAPL